MFLSIQVFQEAMSQREQYQSWRKKKQIQTSISLFFTPVLALMLFFKAFVKESTLATRGNPMEDAKMEHNNSAFRELLEPQ